MLIGIPITFAGLFGIYKAVTSDNNEDTKKNDKYNKLFRNMEILEDKDWVKCVGKQYKKYYRLIKFKLSDSLMPTKFIEKEIDIASKIGCYDVDMEGNGTSRLKIYYENGILHFRIIDKHVEKIPFKVLKPPTVHHLLLGMSYDGEPVFINTLIHPSFCIGGTTGAGKSTIEHTFLINGIEYDQADFFLCDRKQTDLALYKNKKNVLYYGETKKECEDIIGKFKERYEERKILFRKDGKNYLNIDEYNADHPDTPLKRYMLVIDEWMQIAFENMRKGEPINVFVTLIELASLIRNTGGSICICSQRPSCDIFPGVFKNCFQMLGMRCENKASSNVVIGEDGLEVLPAQHIRGRFNNRLNDVIAYYLDEKMIKAEIDKLPNKINTP